MFSFCKVFYFTFSVSSGWHKGVKVFFDTRFQLFRFATVFFSLPALERFGICVIYEKYLATSPSPLCFLKVDLQSLCFGLFLLRDKMFDL